MTDTTLRGDWMNTITGRDVHILTPRPEEIDPFDIAHALGMLCRYNGHVAEFYSVGEHCVLMSERVPADDALWALLHDATEAYLGDMIKPLKRADPVYTAIEDQMMGVICERFGLDPACPASVKEADLRILVDERTALQPHRGRPWKSTENVTALGVPICGWDPNYAKDRYLARLQDLGVAL